MIDMKRSVLTYIMMICSLSVVAVNKHALIFGLGVQEDICWSKVHGDEDVKIVQSMLKKCGFRDIRTVVNENATKQGMAQAFIDLTRKCKSGDIVYIHYSGHGQFMTDIDGDEAERWTGVHAQWDESWIPYDAYMYYSDKDHGEKHFSDDEIARYLTEIRKRIGQSGQLIVVIDACHSGDSTRGEDDGCVRGVDVEFKIPRQPIHDIAKPIQIQWLTISACKPYQLCFEQKSPVAGKLTYALSLIGQRVFKLSNSQLQEELQAYIDKNPARLPQNPVVSGKR